MATKRKQPSRPTRTRKKPDRLGHYHEKCDTCKETVYDDDDDIYRCKVCNFEVDIRPDRQTSDEQSENESLMNFIVDDEDELEFSEGEDAVQEEKAEGKAEKHTCYCASDEFKAQLKVFNDMRKLCGMLKTKFLSLSKEVAELKKKQQQQQK